MNHYFISLGAIIIALFMYYLISKQFNLFDVPNEDRKIHQKSIPTSAGLIFLIPALFSMQIIGVNFLILIPLICLFVISGLDDFFNVSTQLRLIFISLFSAALIYVFYSSDSINNFVLIFYFFSIIWWINLFNFMDGADGIAATHGLIAIGFYFMSFPVSNEAMILIMMAIGIIAFLPFNFPKAIMFMGDSGSVTIAALIAWIAFVGITNEYFGEIFVYSLHMVFIIDATMTFLLRAVNRHKLQTAHNLHCYQSLIHHGLSHYKVTIIYSLLTLITSGVGYFLLKFQLSLKIQLILISAESLILVLLWFRMTDLKRFKNHN